MSDLQDKLNTILGDPQAMGQIMALAQSLSSPAAEPAAAPPAQSPPPPASPDLSTLLGGLDDTSAAKAVALLSRVMDEAGKDDNRRTALLQALRPFVKEQRYAKLDKAIEIARLSRMLRIGFDVLKGGESADV